MIGIGEKLRQAREGRNLSLRELAARADVSASLLSQIENGHSNPSVRTLYNLAATLELPVDYFFPSDLEERNPGDGGNPQTFSDKTASDLRAMTVDGELAQEDIGFGEVKDDETEAVIRAGLRSEIKLRGGVTWSRLTAVPEKGAEFLEVTYEAGATSGAQMSHHSGREFGLVLNGELTIDLAFERYVLQAGDSIIFDSTRPHRMTNNGTEIMRAIWVILEQ
jgi:transcriptional regulator with XRE-family HTH domain